MPARRRWRMIVLGVIAVLGGLALIYAAALWFLQGALIYIPQRTTPELAAAAQAQGAQRLRFAAEGREQIAWLLPAAPGAPRVLWIACIGNGGCAARWFEHGEFLLPTLHRTSGAAILAIDYPGFGECSGSPDPASILALSRAAQAAALVELGWERGSVRIGVLGMSLGTGIASQHAVAEGLDRMVLLSPYTSLLDIARSRQPWPFGYLLRHRYDNRAALAVLATRPGAQVAIYHGDADLTLPVAGSRELAASFPSVVRYHEVPGGGHDTVLDGIVAPVVAEMAYLMR